MSPPANDPGGRSSCVADRPAPRHRSTACPGTPSSSDRSTSWPSASTSESAASSRIRRWAAGCLLASSTIFSTVARAAAIERLLDGRQPLDHHAFLERLFDLEVVRRHPLARAAVDDHRLGGAQALGGARHVDRRVAAAVHHDAAAQHRLVGSFHRAQHAHRIEDARRVPGGDVRPLGDVRADREEGGVEAFRRLPRCRSTMRLSSTCTPRSTMRCISASSTSRGSRYCGMPKRIMPPGSGPASRTVTWWPSRRRW